MSDRSTIGLISVGRQPTVAGDRETETEGETGRSRKRVYIHTERGKEGREGGRGLLAARYEAEDTCIGCDKTVVMLIEVW